MGGKLLTTVARTGTGRFHITDTDRFEVANGNRQYGPRTSTSASPKGDAMRPDAFDVTQILDGRTFPEVVTASNVDVFLIE